MRIRRRPREGRSMVGRCRPSAATSVAVLVTLVLGSQAGVAATSDHKAPQPVRAVEVTETDSTSVTIEWPPSRDNDAVAGYGIFVDGVRVAAETPDQVHKRDGDRQLFSYTVQGLACGKGYTVGVDAYDRSDNHSAVTSTTVSTAACPDTSPPSTPTGMRQVATTESSVMLAWSPSTDNVGVVEYALYASGLRVATVSEPSATLTNLACGTSYMVAVDAADAAGNRSARATASYRTSACPSTNKPPSTPTGLSVTAATQTSVSLAWSAATDDAGVAGYGLYVGGQRTTTTTNLNAVFSGLQCGTTYTLGVDAFDAPGLRSTVAELAAATSPCPPPPPSGTGVVTQTIANGSTIPDDVNWRAVYDGNGDGREDDPGRIEFRVDGNLVLSEELIPFGDSFADGSIPVSNGQHTFQVRAITDTGTLLATNAVNATVATNPPAGDTTPPSTPSSVRVVSASAASVTIAWNASTDNVAVTGYGTYRSASQTGQTQQTQATYSGLTCGTAYQVGVDAYDAAGNRSPRADLAVTTTPCLDNQPPTAPTNVTASLRTTTSITLTWAAATDNVGVAAYGVYNGADLVQTTAGLTGIVSGLTCGTNYTLAVDAFDASGNSSPKTTVMVATLACPADTTPPTQPGNLRLTAATGTSATLAWNTATDNVGVTGYDVFRAGQKVGSTATTSYLMNGLSCGTSYSVAVSAFDAAGNRSPQATISVSTSTCATTPQSCPLPAYPDASCTGVPAGTTLTPSGGLTITVAGTVIDGRDITGQVVVNAPNVTIRNSRIRSNAMWVIDNNSTGLLVEDSEIINRPVSGQPNCHNGIGNSNFTVRRTEITGCENAMNIDSPGSVTLEDTYIHDLDTTGPSYVWGNTPHTDGIQIGPSASNLVFRHNTIDPTASGGATSAIIMSTDSPPNSNFRFEDNYIDGRGASYAIYAPRQQTTGGYINRNRMYRGYGYTACVRVGITVTEFNDNRDAGTGALINPDNGSDGGCSN
jgi:chitodextrinase